MQTVSEGGAGVNVARDTEQFIRDNFYYDGPALDPKASLMESGILDSTGVLELVGFLEERFGIAVEDGDLTPENLDGIDRIVAFVGRKKDE